jgi:undecaprenyl-diphosphatase
LAVVAAALIVVGIILYVADRHGSKKKVKLAQMNFVDWVVIGLAQAVALIPGVSRSGATMSAGLFRGLNRDAAARFSFLLSTPVFMGAAALKIHDLKDTGIPSAEVLPFATGLVTSAIVGYLVIRFLLAYLRSHNVNVFVWYRIALGAAIIGLLIAQR